MGTCSSAPKNEVATRSSGAGDAQTVSADNPALSARPQAPEVRPEQVRAVEKAVKRLTVKVDMVDAKADEILMAMGVILEQLQQRPSQYLDDESGAEARLDAAVQRLSRYQSSAEQGRADFYFENGPHQGLFHAPKVRGAGLLPSLCPTVSLPSRPRGLITTGRAHPCSCGSLCSWTCRTPGRSTPTARRPAPR